MSFGTALRLIGLAAAATWLVLDGTVANADEPIVRINLSPQAIELGESAQMQVTILVPTWQPDPPVYPTFEIPNVITRLPPDSAHPTSERIGRDTWSGIVRNYQVTPLLAADFELGGESIRITWADPGQPDRVLDAAVPTVTLSVRVPEGAAELEPYLAGSRFTVQRTVKGNEQNLNVGDALVIQYRATLDGMPALFIPPLAPEIGSNLVTAYPEEPEVIQAATAERTETVTLILNHGGRIELPEQTFAWWNTNTEQIERASIESRVFEISGPPPPAAEKRLAPENTAALNERTLLLVSLTVLILGGVLWRWLPGLLAARREQAEIHKQSEAYAFEALSHAGDPETAYAAALTWLNRLDPNLDLRGFAADYGDSALCADLDALSRVLFRNSGDEVSLSRFVAALGIARTAYLSAARSGTSAALVPLNPAAS